MSSAPVPSPLDSLVVLSADASGRQIVSVHVKRGYRLLPTGECRRAEMPVPLLFSRDPENEKYFGVPESDVIPFKQSADLIIMAKAHAPRGATRVDVTLALEERTWRYRVWGPRRCIYRGAGSSTFSQPEPFMRHARELRALADANSVEPYLFDDPHQPQLVA